MATDRLIERFMPQWDLGSRHATSVGAAPVDVMTAIEELDMSGSRVASLLVRLRGMPRSALTMEGMLQFGFFELGRTPEHEILFGLAGRFWSPRGKLRRLTPEEFAHFDEPGTARAVWGFTITPAADGVHLSTETRVACSDAKARRRFRIYWFFIAPFSAMIRREALRIVKADAERISSAPR